MLCTFMGGRKVCLLAKHDSVIKQANVYTAVSYITNLQPEGGAGLKNIPLQQIPLISTT